MGETANNNLNALTNLIINYLPQTMTDSELYSMFLTIGPLDSCRVMRDKKTQYSYGFGFVNYVTKEDAAKAIETLNGLEIKGKRLKVSYARPSGEDIKDTNVYVCGLPRNITLEMLDFYFGRFGRIMQKNILKDKITGMPRGVAFIRYDKREEATAAINNMNGVVMDGCIEALTCKIAEDHGKQKAAYFAGWHAGYTQTPLRGKSANGNVSAGVGSVGAGGVGVAGGVGGAKIETEDGSRAMRNERPNYRYNPMTRYHAPAYYPAGYAAPPFPPPPGVYPASVAAIRPRFPKYDF